MAVAPAPGDPAEVTSDHPTSAPRAALFRLVLLCTLAVVLVASLVTIAVLYHDRNLHGLFHQSSDTVQADREAAMAQTQQFVLRVNTYGPSMLDSQGQMPAYRQRVKAVITPKFAVSFDQNVTLAEQSVKNYGLQRSCAVYATGIEAISSDTATVLVAGSLTQTAPNKKGKRVAVGEPAPFRLRVTLDKINGHWLVDDYQPVAS